MLGALVSTSNWVNIIREVIEKKHHSWTPLIGGVLMCCGMLLGGLDLTKGYWWMPFVIDFGCIPGFIMHLAIMILDRVFRQT
jgi:UDP-N-acetylmuramyl pentapeptide phosphotransferase/UDP-N-acetylglucosamine-1-phosphate transferase